MSAVNALNIYLDWSLSPEILLGWSCCGNLYFSPPSCSSYFFVAFLVCFYCSLLGIMWHKLCLKLISSVLHPEGRLHFQLIHWNVHWIKKRLKIKLTLNLKYYLHLSSWDLKPESGNSSSSSSLWWFTIFLNSIFSFSRTFFSCSITWSSSFSLFIAAFHFFSLL